MYSSILVKPNYSRSPHVSSLIAYRFLTVVISPQTRCTLVYPTWHVDKTLWCSVFIYTKQCSRKRFFLKYILAILQLAILKLPFEVGIFKSLRIYLNIFFKFLLFYTLVELPLILGFVQGIMFCA